MEAYAVDAAVASAEAAVAGAGPAVRAVLVMLAELEGIAGFAELEGAAVVRGREVARLALQQALDAQAAAEQRLPAVTGADGRVRRRAEPGCARTVVTVLGEVIVRRIGYRSGVRGVLSLFPRDAVLNLPVLSYSWGLQELVVMLAREQSYEQALRQVRAVTGLGLSKAQAQKIVAAAAANAERFAAGRGRAPARDAAVPLVISADGKGVAVRPADRRESAAAPAQRRKLFEHRTGTGEKTGTRRMAETAVVFDVEVPDRPRTAEQIIRPDPGPPDPGLPDPGLPDPGSRDRPQAPEAVNRWYTCGITSPAAEVITAAFDEAQRRDPAWERPLIGLIDGNNHQIDRFRAEAEARGTVITLLIDYIHVQEYLWKAAWCFHAYPDPAAEEWVSTQCLAILQGRAGDVIAAISGLARARPPRPGSQHDKTIRKTLAYLTAKQPWLDYPAALENGWPIATGVIEGACRHLVKDRMGITGARWGLPGAQAILWLRAIDASGETDAYWTSHLQHEHQRNHLSRYQDTRQFQQAA
jgi:hypothetical protein